MTGGPQKFRAFVRAMFWGAFGAFWAGAFFIERCSDTVALYGLFAVMGIAAAFDLASWLPALTGWKRMTIPAMALWLTGIAIVLFFAGLHFGWTGLTELYPEAFQQCF